MVRKTVNILGILCLVLVLAAAGVVATFVVKGTLTRDSLKAAMEAVTRPPARNAATQAAASQPAKSSAEDPSSDGEDPEADKSDEAQIAEAARLEMMRRQLTNEQALVQAARVNLQREQEQFEQGRKQWETGRQQEQAVAQRTGAQKELDYLSSIKPAQALEVLRAKSDDEASGILMAMETRKGKKIIELCKTADEKEWLKRILEMIRQQSNVQAQALTGG